MDIAISTDQVKEFGLETAFILNFIKAQDGTTYKEIEEVCKNVSKNKIRQGVSVLESKGLILVEQGLLENNIALILYTGDDTTGSQVAQDEPKQKKPTRTKPRKKKAVKKPKPKKDTHTETPNMFGDVGEPEHMVQKFIRENLNNVSKLKDQMTYEQAEKLIGEYGAEPLHDVLLAMENRKTLTKDYKSAYLTALNWLKNRKGSNAKTTHRSGYNKKHPTRGDDQARQIERYS
jgi:hypothetical protein